MYIINYYTFIIYIFCIYFHYPAPLMVINMVTNIAIAHLVKEELGKSKMISTEVY